MHYIGSVMKVNEEDLTVNFLKRSDPFSSHFIYPEKPDIVTVSRDDVIKVPHPMISGGTERVALKMKFNFNISDYQNPY